MRVRVVSIITALVFAIGVSSLATHPSEARNQTDFSAHSTEQNMSKSVPTLLNYQGFLATSDSSAVTTTLEMTFRLFDSETKGTELWSETHSTVDVSDGLFQVLLGSQSSFPAGLFGGSALWLQTEIGTEVLSPRKAIVSVAYSQMSENADQATNAQWANDAQHAVHADTAAYTQVAGMTAADSAAVAGNAHQLGGESLSDLDNRYTSQDDLDHLDAADGSPANAVYVDNDGKVGIGQMTPAHLLDVNGDVSATAYYGDGSHLTGISGTTDNDWTISGSDMYSSVSGNVGIGTTSPAVKLDVGGAINTDAYYQIGGTSVLSVPDSVNTIVGVGAGGSKAGYYGTLVGYHAGSHNQANYNTFVGGEAGYENTTGTLNTFVGAVAGSSNTTGSSNTFVGGEAGRANTTGVSNTFIGSGAGYENTTGLANTFIGHLAGEYNTGGIANTFVGQTAGEYNTTGIRNTFLGQAAGESNETGNSNTFLGKGAGLQNTEGYENTFVGANAGVGNTSGDHNTFVGTEAGAYNTVGDTNTFVGWKSGFGNSLGNKNTFLGSLAGLSNTTGTGNVFVGHCAGFYETGSNKLYIANNENDSSVIIYGDFSTGDVGIGTLSPGYRLQVGESGDGTEARANAWNTFSSRDYKKNITSLTPSDYEKVLQKLGELDVVRYHYNGDVADRKLRIGLIAEEAPEEMTSEDGKAMSLSDSMGFLIAALKAQQEHIETLDEEIETLKLQLRNPH